MARSRRKPWIVDRNQFFRKHHNRRLRRLPITEEIPDGKAYRKYGDTWAITDYRWQARKPSESDLFRWSLYNFDQEQIEKSWRSYHRTFRK